MADFFDIDQLEKMQGTTVRIEPLIEMHFKSETVRVWNGHHELNAGGKLWQPIHGNVLVDGLASSSGTQSRPVTLTLSGIPDQDPDIFALAFAESYEADQQFAEIYLQFFDDQNAPAGSPVSIFHGWMQQPESGRSAMSDDSGSTQSISLQIENAMFNRSRPPFGRLTDRDQQHKHPGDLYCQLVPSLLFKQFTYPDW